MQTCALRISKSWISTNSFHFILQPRCILVSTPSSHPLCVQRSSLSPTLIPPFSSQNSPAFLLLGGKLVQMQNMLFLGGYHHPGSPEGGPTCSKEPWVAIVYSSSHPLPFSPRTSRRISNLRAGADAQPAVAGGCHHPWIARGGGHFAAAEKQTEEALEEELGQDEERDLSEHQAMQSCPWNRSYRGL
jgi:hypothetical protein